MTNFFLYIAWIILYGLCAGLGCIGAPTGWLYGLCIAASILFFLPPALLLHRADKRSDRKTITKILFISLAWLTVTLLLIICNILSIGASELAGTILHYLLVVCTAPMICGQIWLLIIFFWACLMSASIKLLKKTK